MANKLYVPNNNGQNLDVEIYKTSKDSSKVIIFSTAFATHMDYNPIYKKFAKSASEDYNVFLYSFVGTGKSEGVFSNTSLETQRDDLNSIIKYARENFSNPKICLAGHSLGATVSIISYFQNEQNKSSEDISALMTWNSSINTQNLSKRYAKHYADESKMTYEHFRELTSEHMTSGRKMWESFSEMNPIENLKNVKIPILALFGEKDDLIKSHDTRIIIESLPKGKCEIIPESDHEITSVVAQDNVIKESMAWLKDNF